MATAANVTAATISARLTLESQNYDKGLADASTKAKTFGNNLSTQLNKTSTPMNNLAKGFESLTGVSLLAGAGIGIATAAITKFVDFMQQAEAAANESNIVQAKQEAILRATGYAANTTSAELQKMASEMSRLNGIDDEAIATSQSLLLTFRNIGREAFPRAQQAAIDLQTTFGSLDSASLQLGKALNDPIKGVTALSRSGVTFSETQKRMIKDFVEMGDIAAAQAIILEEVEHQVGGTAAAIEEASDGSNRASIAFENMSEAIGQSLIPVTRAWNNWLADTYDSITENIENSGRYTDALITNARAMGISQEAIQQYLSGSRKLSPELEAAIIKTLELTAVSDEVEKQMRDLGYTLNSVTGEWSKNAAGIQEDIEAMTKANLEALKGVEQFENLYSSSNEKLTDLYDERWKLEGELQTLRNQGWSEESTKIQEVNGKLGENATAIQEVANEHRTKTNEIILDYATQILAADGLTTAELDGLMEWGRAAGIYSEEAMNAYKSARIIAQDLSDTISEIPSSKTVTVDVITRYTDEYGRRAVDSAPGRATGGPGSGQTWVGEMGPELVDLPAGSYVNNNRDSMRMTESSNKTDPMLVDAITSLNATTEMLPDKISRAIRQNVKYMR